MPKPKNQPGPNLLLSRKERRLWRQRPKTGNRKHERLALKIYLTLKHQGFKLVP